MISLITLVRTLVVYTIIGIVGALIFIPCLIIAALPVSWRYDNRLYYWVVDFFYKIVLRASFVPISIKGKSHLPASPAIYIANHQSSLDIPLVGSLLNGKPHIWLFLARYGKIPLFGFIARRMNVVVDPKGPRSLVKALKQAIALADGKNRNIILFPEGGRSRDGTIKPFFYGFAILARKLERPIVPVIMLNVEKVYPPGSFLIHRYPINIIIGKPFKLEPDETDEMFVSRVHQWFVEHAQGQRR